MSDRNIYFDSDSVIYPFMQWCRQYDPSITTTDSEKIYKVMAEHYIDCFDSNLNPLPHCEFFLDTLRHNPNAYVLTALTPAEKLAPYTDDPEYAVQYHRHNKLQWFSRLGIDESKIIIVNNSKEKLIYCSQGDILFDDFQKNLDRWEEHGGVGVLVIHPSEKDLQFDRYMKAETAVDTLSQILRNLTDPEIKSEIRERLPEFGQKVFGSTETRQIVL